MKISCFKSHVKMLSMLALSSLLGACTVIGPPPLLTPEAPRRSLDIRFTQLRLMVDEAVDRTSLAGGVVEAGLPGGALRRVGSKLISDSLTMGVAPSVEGGSITTTVQGEPGQKVVNASQSGIDFLVAGGSPLTQTLAASLKVAAANSTRFHVVSSERKTGCDLRVKTYVTAIDGDSLRLSQTLESCEDGVVVSSLTSRVSYQSRPGQIEVAQKDLQVLTKKIVDLLPDTTAMGRGLVLKREGRYVTLNLGKEQGLYRGMKALAVAAGDNLIDPSTGFELGNEVFVGELYVMSVYDKWSRAYVLTEASEYYGDNSSVRVGDAVVFK